MRCDFEGSGFFYSCWVSEAAIVAENIPIRFFGVHLEGFNDSHVISLNSNSFTNEAHIFVITKELVQQYPNLQLLDVGWSNVQRVHPNAFERCENLRTFSANGNINLNLPATGLFRNCTQLQQLSFTNCDMNSISTQLFEGLNQLQTLGLRGNRFTTLPANLFVHTPSLRHLTLGANPLQAIPENIFRNLFQLQFLDMDSANIQILNPNWFIDLTSLEVLYLWRNEISEIPNGIFQNMQNLQNLDIGSNRIWRLNSFGHLAMLNTIWIGGNNLREIQPNFFSNFPVLNVFNAQGGNICVNSQVGNVSLIDFEQQNVFDPCFQNWLNPIPPPTTEGPTTPGKSVKDMPMTILIFGLIFCVFKI